MQKKQHYHVLNKKKNCLNEYNNMPDVDADDDEKHLYVIKVNAEDEYKQYKQNVLTTSDIDE